MDTTEDLTRPASTKGWRVVDIVVAAVLGVAIGLVFFAYNGPGYAAFESVDALTPGLGGLLAGVWLLGGPLGALVIRKPGAALFVELLAAIVSMALGTIWGWETVASGFAQGLGAEVVFALAAYRRWNLGVAMLAGAGAGAAAWVNEFILGNHAKSLAFNGTYLVCLLISGAILAGLLGWLLTRALASAGALDRFASGRDAR